MQCFPEIKQIEKNEISNYPLRAFEGEIEVIVDQNQVDQAVSYLKTFNVLGFDTETRPSFKKGRKNEVALLQLSTQTKAFLFRLNTIGLPKQLKSILEDSDIVKVGAAIHDDLKDLKKLLAFKDAGFIDLQSYVKQFDIESFGVKKMSALVLGFRISKSQQVSNWENNELTESQIKYAATDAWVCLEIFNKLKQYE